MIFKKKIQIEEYDKDRLVPVIKASICNGEKVAGFKDVHSGAFEDVMLIKNDSDLEIFKKRFGIEGKIETIY